jgi:transglutaminase-like putative cysteine protease
MSRTPLRADRRRALYASTAWLIGPLLPMSAVLARVLIDASDPDITSLAASLVRGRATTRERAVAIHDFVRDEIRFGYAPQFYAMSATEVLAASIGFGNTKATLFIALLRAAGIEARQQFVELDAAIWRGLLDLRTPFIDHSYVEVSIGGAWIATDSYTVDRTLARAAQAALRHERERTGYGVRVDGQSEWDGQSPAFVQFAPGRAASRHLWGVFNDVADFYASVPNAWNRRTDASRVVFPLAALTANQAADMLRQHGAGAVRSSRWPLRG